MELSGYPSIDKPWLKYYSSEAINSILPKCKIYDDIWNNNKNNLDDVAINYFDSHISYGEMFSNIEGAAKSFSNMGVRKGDIVAVVSVTLPEIIYTFYGLNRIGAISNMIDPRTSIEGIRNYIEEVSAKVVVVIDLAYSRVAQAVVGTTIENIIVVSPSDSLPFIKRHLYLMGNKVSIATGCFTWREFIASGKETNLTDTDYIENECCVIVHTGGTTGMPKGVMLSNENINAGAKQCDLSGFCLNRGDRWLGIMPPFIAYGICNSLHLPLSIGMELIIIPKFDPNTYDKLLIKYKPTHIVGVPSHYQKVVDSKKVKNLDMSFILSPVVGGDGIKEEHEKEISSFLLSHGCGTNLIKGYGMTEICAAAAASAQMTYNKTGSVGIPFTHTTISVFDKETGKELTYNQEGEVCMKGPHVMLGYYNNDVATKEVLKKHEDGSIWLHSGDLGYIDEDGCLFIKGRLKRMIIRHDGFKVFPTQIENVLEEHEAVKDCCVVGHSDTVHSEGCLPVAFIVLENGVKESEGLTDELRSICERELPEYALPVEYNYIPSLPLTSIGKIDYRVLEKKAN
ncbi:long-chain acyl-CoA synthetase [Butyrivibrio proteoclasticus]|uniref:Long-chain acyl-CoA synthetase n=1 Tax=Butyrivibrio proteoclasticus TaxID=43305 RepID=A0A1I5YAQ5_9FIRM|nr:class I adenylate-forming enzyme family protein [Butyrivibrio proteoclasticus]SFQ41302.1 long-chain acyl-CoA synthetase [Butyrivibrio proteoclasticus]